MKSRPVLLLLALVTALIVGTTGVANAAAPDPVSAVSIDSQTQGANHTWVLGISWQPSPNADSYRVAINDHDGGLNSPGSYYASRNTQALNATLSTDDLIVGNTYWITVRALTGTEDSIATTQAFTAITLDTTGPTGTYTLDKTASYLEFPDDFYEDEAGGFAKVRITQTSLSDNITPAGDITRRVFAGDGSAARTWSGSSPIELKYTAAGNYSPQVELTDAAGNTALLDLPGVQIRKDSTAPVVKINKPANPTKVASWRRISGSSTDTGVGIAGTQVYVLLKKPNGYWYVYSFAARKFVKGKKTLLGTYKSVRPSGYYPAVTPTGTWRTPWISGLTKGTLRVMASSYDKSFNIDGTTRTQAIS